MLIKPKIFGAKGFFRIYTKRSGSLGIQCNSYRIIRHYSKVQRCTSEELTLSKGSMHQAKLVRVAQGSVFDVAVWTLRRDSPTYGRHATVVIKLDTKSPYFSFLKDFAHTVICTSLRQCPVFNIVCGACYPSCVAEGIRYDDPSLSVRRHWIHAPYRVVVTEDLALPLFSEIRMSRKKILITGSSWPGRDSMSSINQGKYWVWIVILHLELRMIIFNG